MTTLRRIRTVATGVAGTPWYTNMHFTWVTGTEQDHIDIVGDFWTAIAGLLINDVAWTVEGDCAVIDDTTGAITGVESATQEVVLGTDTGSALPPATQAMVHWLTSTFLGGRQLRGKTFIPGIGVNENSSSGQLATASRTTLTNAAAALIAASSTPGPLRVFSKTNLTSAVVTSTSTPLDFSVLRSRRD